MAKIVRRNFPVTGMGCAACVARVQNRLQEQKGVQAVNVSLASNSAQVDYDPSVCTPEVLRKAVQDAGYDLIIEGTEDQADDEADRRRQDDTRLLRRQTLTAVIIATIMMILGMAFKPFPFKGYILWILATVVLVLCGRRFFVNAWKQLRRFSANMDILVALSVTISYLFSVFNLLFPEKLASQGVAAHLYFESSAMIVAFILLGRLLEERAKQGTTASIRALMGLQVRTVTVQKVEVIDGMPLYKEYDIPVGEVVPGDVVIVKPGERVSVDGIVTDGESYLDESMLTGESVPVWKSRGARVYAGTVNRDGSLFVRTTGAGKDTVLASIIKMVRDAQGSKAPVQQVVDKVAAVFVPVVIGLSLLTLGLWMLFGGPLAAALTAAVSVLVIACPCSLGLATPTAIVAGIGNGASRGILIKDAASLQVASRITTLVLDKTGTLTTGKPRVVSAWWNPDSPEAADVIYSLELRSEHPLSDAVVSCLDGIARQRSVRSFENIPGMGVRGEVDGTFYHAGNRALVAEVLGDVPVPDERASIFLFSEAGILAALVVQDTVKETSADTVRALSGRGIRVVMLTGDNEAAAVSVATETGISEYRSGTLPQEKAAYIKSLQGQGEVVAMAGDGINDSAALATADLGIAMGKGSDIAIDTAMVTIVSSDLGKIPALVSLSRRTVRIIKENLFWAFFYNLLAVPVAAGALYPLTGFLLDPMIAAACMALSSVCVVTNSLRLARTR